MVSLLGPSCQNPAFMVVWLRIQKQGFRSLDDDHVCDVFQGRCVDRDLFERGHHRSHSVVDEVWDSLTAKSVCWQKIGPGLTVHRSVIVDKMFVFMFVFLINHQSNRYLVIFRFTKRSQNGSEVKARNRLISTLDLRIFDS